MCCKKKLISDKTCLALTERNTLNPKHNTKASLRNLLVGWAVNSIIAMTNANFPEKKKVSSVGPFINESYYTLLMSLCKSYAMPVKQILTTREPQNLWSLTQYKEKPWTTDLAFPLILWLRELFWEESLGFWF